MVVTSTDEAVVESFEKMSKSKFNGINPKDFVEQWGVTMARLYVLYAAAPHEDILWDDKSKSMNQSYRSLSKQ